MKRSVLLISVMAVSLLSSAALAEEGKPKDPNQLFYTANNYYEKRDYVKAVEEYLKILDLGLESGSLYYNIGNGFLKMGKVGYAILCYEKGRRLMPRDSDLRSNLSYARSLVGNPELQIRAQKNIAVKIIERPFRHLTLNGVAISAAILYLVLIAFQTLFLLSPSLKRRLLFLFVIFLLLFVFNLTGFGLRYYEENVLKRGVIVLKDVECKYEPIDSSTTYYTISEGSDCYILKTRNGWRQIKRPDGRIGWVKKDAAEEV